MLNNKLNAYDSYVVEFILAAFKSGEDACSTDISGMVIQGVPVPGAKCSSMIIVNETLPKIGPGKGDFRIGDAIWDFNFFSSVSPVSPISTGLIEIREAVGHSFLSFLNDQVQGTLGVSLSQMTFALRPFFRCGSIDGTTTILPSDPYIFNLSHITSSVSNDSPYPSGNTLHAISSAYGYGYSPQISSLSQVVVTHRDGSLHGTVPTPDGSTSGLMLRPAEDGAKTGARRERIDKSKPMKTLKDVFNALETDLNSKVNPHQIQLQRWMETLKDGHLPKISDASQKKLEGLPVEYHIDLDQKFEGYEIDNRNLPFEQPEQKQSETGIRAIPTRGLESVVSLITRIMKMSKKVADDARKSRSETFKVYISAYTTCSKVLKIHIVIRPYILPLNGTDGEIDTGPGKGRPLEYVVRPLEVKTAEQDVLFIEIKQTSFMKDKVLETVNSESEAAVVFGDREQITLERTPMRRFFDTMNSGLRIMDRVDNFGLEDGGRGSDVSGIVDRTGAMQTTLTKICVKGNYGLLGSVNRDPVSVANEVSGPWNYPLPEYEPMYLKLLVHEKDSSVLSTAPEDRERTPEKYNRFYHTQYFHISRVVNEFREGLFFQDIDLRRTDPYQ